MPTFSKEILFSCVVSMKSHMDKWLLKGILLPCVALLPNLATCSTSADYLSSDAIGEFYRLPTWMPRQDITNPADCTRLVLSTNEFYVTVVTNMAYAAVTNDVWTALWTGEQYRLNTSFSSYHFGGIYPTSGDWYLENSPTQGVYLNSSSGYKNFEFYVGIDPVAGWYNTYSTNNIHRLTCDDEHQLWRTIEIVPNVFIDSVVTNIVSATDDWKIGATNVLVTITTNYIVEAVTNDVWRRLSDGQEFPLTYRTELPDGYTADWEIDDGYSGISLTWNANTKTGEALYWKWAGTDPESDDIWEEGGCSFEDANIMSLSITPTNTVTGDILETETFSRIYNISATTNLATIIAEPFYYIYYPQSIVTNFYLLVTNIVSVSTNYTITAITNDYWVLDGYYRPGTGTWLDNYPNYPASGLQLAQTDKHRWEAESQSSGYVSLNYTIEDSIWVWYVESAYPYDLHNTNEVESATELWFGVSQEGDTETIARLHHVLDVHEFTNATVNTIYETTNMPSRARLRPDRYASIVAANESVLERTLYTGGSSRRPIPDLLENYSFSYGGMSISGSDWDFDKDQTARITHLQDYLNFVDIARHSNRFSVFSTPNCFTSQDYYENDPPAEVSSSALDAYEPLDGVTFAAFDWVCTTQRWDESTFPKGGGVTFGCVPPDEVLLPSPAEASIWGQMSASWGLVEKYDSELSSNPFFMTNCQPVVTNNLPEIIGTTPLKDWSYWTNDTMRLCYDRLATFSSLYAMADRTFHFGYDLTWDVPQCYTVVCHTVTVPYTNVYNIGIVQVTPTGDITGYNTFANGIDHGALSTNIVVHSEVPEDSPHNSWKGSGDWTYSTYGGVVSAVSKVQEAGLPSDIGISVPGAYNITKASLSQTITAIYDGSPVITGRIGYSRIEWNGSNYVVYFSGTAQTSSGEITLSTTYNVNVEQASGQQQVVSGDIVIEYATLQTYPDTSTFTNAILEFPDSKAFSTERVKNLEVGSFARANVITNEYAFSWDKHSMADHDGYNVWLNPQDPRYTSPAFKFFEMNTSGTLPGNRAGAIQTLKSYASEEIHELINKSYLILNQECPGWNVPGAYGRRNASKVQNVWESDGAIGLQASIGVSSENKNIVFEAHDGQLFSWGIEDANQNVSFPEQDDEIPELITVLITLTPHLNEGVEIDLDAARAVESESFHMYRTDWAWKTLKK